jgi:hypothetical protein
MTVATTVLGLLPIMFSSGSGMDITQPIATPTFGGMISSTIYVLFLIPCLFAIGDDIRRRWPERFGSPAPNLRNDPGGNFVMPTGAKLPPGSFQERS